VGYKDYFEVLEVTRDASAQDIQRAYRKLAKQYHPDVNKSPGAEDKFKEVQEAYDVLKDPDKKRLYEKYGPQWKAISEGRAYAPPPGQSQEFKFDFGPFVGSNVNDLRSIFEQVFTATPGEGRRRRPPGRRSDQETTLELGVSSAYRGGPREIQFGDTGSGEPKRLSVQVPAGVRPGQRIRLSGQAASGGDLYLVVKIVSDDRFRLVGDDIQTILRVTPSEAVLGGSAPLATLDGRVKVKIPPGSSTGRNIRLRERGYFRKEGGRGDLLAEIQVVVPEKPTDEERALYEKLAEVSKFDPRR
jgi:curved DNA-binding protein